MNRPVVEGKYAYTVHGIEAVVVVVRLGKPWAGLPDGLYATAWPVNLLEGFKLFPVDGLEEGEWALVQR
jgi:hypothetical protein